LALSFQLALFGIVPPRFNDTFPSRLSGQQIKTSAILLKAEAFGWLFHLSSRCEDWCVTTLYAKEYFKKRGESRKIRTQPGKAGRRV